MATPPAIPKALARIAMFHGGGSTERIFETQCAPLQKQLESEFELVYFAAPHTSSAGAGILPYFNFEEWGPYLGWYAKQENGEEYLDGSSGQYGDEEGIERVVRLMRECGPGGKWVGCLGFSQGTRVVSGLLLWQQQQRQKQQSTTETSLDNEIIDIQFGVLCMGAGEPMTSTMPECMFFYFFNFPPIMMPVPLHYGAHLLLSKVYQTSLFFLSIFRTHNKITFFGEFLAH